MILGIISDTHQRHREIVWPEEQIDCLIHCGDITRHGELSAIEDFAKWLKAIPCKHKLISAGNHDWCFQSGHPNRSAAIKLLQEAGATYLEHETIVIDGIKMFFSPYTPRFFDWAFNVNRGKDIAEKWKSIPDDCVVLCTHGPSHGVLDRAPRSIFGYENVGCEELRKVIDTRLKQLKIHAHGHIHADAGVAVHNGVVVVNAAICTETYKATNPVRIIEI